MAYCVAKNVRPCHVMRANVIQAVMAKGRRKGFLVILAVSLLAAESSLQASDQTADPVQVLFLNSQWNSAYARAACESAGIWYKTVGKEIEPLGCENFPACPDLMATAKACRSANPAAALRDFEQKIIGSLASDAACAHVTVVRYTGVGDAVYDNLAKLHDPEDFWNLSVNFHPGLTKQPWQVKHRAATTSGNDDAQTIAGQTCLLIVGEGAKAN
jgi:hypothetical protein